MCQYFVIVSLLHATLRNMYIYNIIIYSFTYILLIICFILNMICYPFVYHILIFHIQHYVAFIDVYLLMKCTSLQHYFYFIRIKTLCKFLQIQLFQNILYCYSFSSRRLETWSFTVILVIWECCRREPFLSPSYANGHNVCISESRRLEMWSFTVIFVIWKCCRDNILQAVSMYSYWGDVNVRNDPPRFSPLFKKARSPIHYPRASIPSFIHIL